MIEPAMSDEAFSQLVQHVQDRHGRLHFESLLRDLLCNVWQQGYIAGEPSVPAGNPYRRATSASAPVVLAEDARKQETARRQQVVALVVDLACLLAKAHPGLATWHEAVEKLYQELLATARR